MAFDPRQQRKFEELQARLRKSYGSGSLYDALGVKPGATEDEITKRYRKMAFEFHPDRNKAPDAEQRFKDLQAINNILSKPEERASYDAWLATAGGAGAGSTGQPGAKQWSQHHSNQGAGAFGSSSHSTGSSDSRSGVYVNGVELPKEFAGRRTVIINGGRQVIISYGGTKYAEVNGGVHVHDMPPGGKIKFDGLTIEYQSSGSGSQPHVRVSKGGIFSRQEIVTSGGGVINIGNGGSVVMGGVHSSGSSWHGGGGFYGSGLETEINRAYDNISAVSVTHGDGDIRFGFSKDRRVYVKGNVSEKPLVSDGKLAVAGLDGILELLLPKERELNLSVLTGDGALRGDIAHQGRIATGDGPISLNLHSPLELQLRTGYGLVNVSNMISRGGGIYSPPNQKSTGKLEVKTGDGSISINYVGRA
ncbi:J domain-containing protein [Candidatus Woesearchaeota archaeon]|nr:J domain-containing protein [Candidatus Woesearchaeota archaeon]